MTRAAHLQRLPKGGAFLPRRARRALGLPTVVMLFAVSLIVLEGLSNEAARVADQNRAAGYATGILLKARALDANLALGVANGQIIADLPGAVMALPASELPTDANVPFAVIPASWTVTSYAASIADSTGALQPFGILYIKLPPAQAGLTADLRAYLQARADAAALTEPEPASYYLNSALGHALDPSDEIAIYTAPYADLDPSYVLRSARPGWPLTPMETGLSMGGQSLTASGVMGTAASGQSVTGGDLTAGDLSVSKALSAGSASIAGSLSAKTMTANLAQAARLSATTLNSTGGMTTDSMEALGLNAQKMTAPEAAVAETLTLTGTPSVQSAQVSGLSSPAQSALGSITANSLGGTGIAATNATIPSLKVQSCSGC